MVKTVSKKTLNSKKIIQKGGADLICPSDIKVDGASPVIIALARILNSPTPLTQADVHAIVGTLASDPANNKTYTFALVNELGANADEANKGGIEALKKFLESATTEVDGKQENAVSTDTLIGFLQSRDAFIGKFEAGPALTPSSARDSVAQEEVALTPQSTEKILKEKEFVEDGTGGNDTKTFTHGDKQVTINSSTNTIVKKDGNPITTMGELNEYIAGTRKYSRQLGGAKKSSKKSPKKASKKSSKKVASKKSSKKMVGGAKKASKKSSKKVASKKVTKKAASKKSSKKVASKKSSKKMVGGAKKASKKASKKSSKKVASKKVASKKSSKKVASKKSSKKMVGGAKKASKKSSKKVASKKPSKKVASKKPSKKMVGGAKKASKKSSKKVASKKVTKKAASKKSSKKTARTTK